jgi:hypothetical protein
MPRLLGSALNETGLSHFILSSSWHIEGFLLLPKILAFRKPDCLPLAALQVAFSILIHLSASMRYVSELPRFYQYHYRTTNSHRSDGV